MAPHRAVAGREVKQLGGSDLSSKSLSEAQYNRQIDDKIHPKTGIASASQALCHEPLARATIVYFHESLISPLQLPSAFVCCLRTLVIPVTVRDCDIMITGLRGG